MLRFEVDEADADLAGLRIGDLVEGLDQTATGLEADLTAVFCARVGGFFEEVTDGAVA